jgi:hypothetical protein
MSEQEQRRVVMAIVTRSTSRSRPCCAGYRAGGRVARSNRRRSRRAVTVEGSRLFFSGRIAQQVESPSAVDWLTGAAMLLAAVSWGVLVSLLGS